jgi:hypothetical protein
MKPWERWTFNASAIVVTVTGLAYLWMKYFLSSDDPFAVVNHPWQAAMLQVHLLASPVLLLVVGVMLNSHILRKLGASGLRGRTSGYASLAALALMAASGYLLQVAGGDAWIRPLVIVHVGSGSAFAILYAAHLVVSARAARRRRAPAQVLEVA